MLHTGVFLSHHQLEPTFQVFLTKSLFSIFPPWIQVIYIILRQLYGSCLFFFLAFLLYSCPLYLMLWIPILLLIFVIDRFPFQISSWCCHWSVPIPYLFLILSLINSYSIYLPNFVINQFPFQISWCCHWSIPVPYLFLILSLISSHSRTANDFVID